MLGRRAFLTRLGIGAIAAPAAAKHALDTATAQLAGISATGLANGPGGDEPSSCPPTAGFDSRAAMRKLLDTPGLRDEYTSMMFERRRHVGMLDLDLANKRSFSLAAKVTFQRHRNVEREIAEEAAQNPYWRRGEGLLRKAMSWPGL